MDCGVCKLPLERGSHGNRRFHDSCKPKKKRNKYKLSLDLTTKVRPVEEIKRTGFVNDRERQALKRIVSIEAKEHEERWNRMFRFQKTA